MSELRVLLRDTLTGREGWYAEDWSDAPTEFGDPPTESARSCWLSGNNSCDCNRGSCLAQALGEPDPKGACGETRYAIVAATWDGQPLDDWTGEVA